MKLAFHLVNTHWLRASLHSLVSVKEPDLPLSGNAIKHAMAERKNFFLFTLATKSYVRYS